MMFELGCFHNRCNGLPVIDTKDALPEQVGKWPLSRFEKVGSTGGEFEDMMRYFAQECAPALRAVCRGRSGWDSAG